MNHWNKLERPGVLIENGHVTAITLAVIDVPKEEENGNDSHGSKIIVIPFDGAALDRDLANADKARQNHKMHSDQGCSLKSGACQLSCPSSQQSCFYSSIHRCLEVIHQMPEDEECEITDLGGGFWRVALHFGYQAPSRLAEISGSALTPAYLPIDSNEVTYYVSRQTLLSTKAS